MIKKLCCSGRITNNIKLGNLEFLWILKKKRLARKRSELGL